MSDWHGLAESAVFLSRHQLFKWKSPQDFGVGPYKIRFIFPQVLFSFSPHLPMTTEPWAATSPCWHYLRGLHLFPQTQGLLFHVNTTFVKLYQIPVYSEFKLDSVLICQFDLPLWWCPYNDQQRVFNVKTLPCWHAANICWPELYPGCPCWPEHENTDWAFWIIMTAWRNKRMAPLVSSNPANSRNPWVRKNLWLNSPGRGLFNKLLHAHNSSVKMENKRQF